MPRWRKDSGYYELLMRLRKQFDVWPFMEIATGTLAAGAPKYSVAPFNVTPPYKLMWNEMPFVGFDVGAAVGTAGIGQLSMGGGSFNWWTGSQADLVQLAQQSLATEDILGALNDKWVELEHGAFLEEDEPWQAQFTLGAEYNAGAGLLGAATLYTGLRGYQLWSKGSIAKPLQMTREEMLASGKFRPRSYFFAGVVNVTMVGGAGLVVPQTPAQTQLTISPPGNLACDFMCESISIRPKSPPVQTTFNIGFDTDIYQWIPAVLAGIVPSNRPQAFQGSSQVGNASLTLAPWQCWQGVDYSLFAYGQTITPTPVYFPPQARLETEWELPVPVTFANNERLNLVAQALPIAAKFHDTYVMPMEFVLRGELLIPV